MSCARGKSHKLINSSLTKMNKGISKCAPIQIQTKPFVCSSHERPITAFVAKISIRLAYNFII